MINNIEEGINYIHSLPKVHKNSNLNFIKKALNKLNNPQDQYDVIHITGTNGKGSVSHFINEMLIDTQYDVGMFTSPYIVKFNERFQINNQFISDTELLRLIKQIKQVVDEIQLQDSEFYLVEFEFVTVLGLLYFREKQVDVAVIEVGIGGTHDKTNVVKPIVSVINNVGMDHKQLIGPTLSDIAREKSGIIKTNSAVVLGDIKHDLLSIFTETATKNQATIYQLNKEFEISNVNKQATGFIFDFKDDYQTINNIKVSGIAKFQVKNAAVAIEAFVQYQNYRKQRINSVEIKSAINKVQMLARMQVINKQPLIILDGAHNEHAAKALVKSIGDNFDNKKIKYLIAMMKDKDFHKVIDILETVSDDITLTTFNENRSLKNNDITDSRFIENWQEFINDFRTQETDKILIITGSLHFVSLVRDYFGQK